MRGMIEQPPGVPERGAWRRILSEGIADLDELLDTLGLDPVVVGDDSAAAAAVRQFAVRVPRGFVARMRPGDPDDPLLRQVLAHAREETPVPGFGIDPVGELSAATAPGLLSKYQGRVLVVVAGACAVHCRYCFRRHFPYPAHAVAGRDWGPTVAAVAADPTVEEVILSGGDPLMLPDERLAALADALAEIPHLRRLRVHSRMPVVLPERVDDALLEWLAGTRLTPVMVVHANHARELDAPVRAALGRLRAAGVTVLTQSVLLRGVNDSVTALADLSRALCEAGALPYYLHLLDPVAGAAHFDVPEPEARALVGELMTVLPGYLVPRLVREQPGALAKIPVTVRPSAATRR
jgi:EF-P beta-lysylation protein EpmB